MRTEHAVQASDRELEALPGHRFGGAYRMLGKNA